MNMKYSQEEIDKMKELGYSYSTAFDGVFIKLEAMEDTKERTRCLTSSTECNSPTKPTSASTQ